MLELPSMLRPLIFSSHFAANSFGWKVQWMLFQFDHELQETRHDLSTFLNETSMFLRSPSDSQHTPQRHAAGLSLVPLLAVRLFGSGVVMGSSISCGLPGIFGGCQDEAKAKVENILRLLDFRDALTHFFIFLCNSLLIMTKNLSQSRTNWWSWTQFGPRWHQRKIAIRPLPKNKLMALNRIFFSPRKQPKALLEAAV